MEWCLRKVQFAEVTASTEVIRPRFYTTDIITEILYIKGSNREFCASFLNFSEIY